MNDSMKHSDFSNSNRLIRKSIMRTYPSSFAATLAGSMSLMCDSILAGSLISQLAIAAVAIGNPITAVFRSLIQAIANGAGVRLTVATGRNNKEEANRAHSLGILGSIVVGLALMLVALFAADALVLLFGGSGNPNVADMAAMYLRACSPMILGSALNMYFGKALSLFGCQRESFIISLIGVLANLGFSILAVKLLPVEMAIAGLGIGTTIGSLLQVLLNFIIMHLRHIPLKFHFYKFSLREIGDALKLGFPSASNNLIDGLIAAVINNIILAGFGGDAMALSVYSAVKGVAAFAQCAALACSMSSSPLFGLLYGARDKNGIRRTLRESMYIGLICSVIWCAVLIALLPLLMKFYGMAGNALVRSGVYVTFLFTPVILVLRVMTNLFESTERFTMGMLYSIVPDSVIYPLMLLVLLPIWGYTGIWISYGANGIVFLLVLYIVRSLKSRSTKMNFDRFVCLDESVRDNVPRLDISIHANSEDISSISTQVHSFLKEDASEKTAYMSALCLEELAADFAAHTETQKGSKQEIMDIKLFLDEQNVRIVLRNTAKRYNPLDFELDKETFSKVGVKLVQKVAQHIDYSYVYKMNIVTIDLAR